MTNSVMLHDYLVILHFEGPQMLNMNLLVAKCGILLVCMHVSKREFLVSYSLKIYIFTDVYG